MMREEENGHRKAKSRAYFNADKREEQERNYASCEDSQAGETSKNRFVVPGKK